VKIFIATGEVSGDIAGARLAASICEIVPDASLFGHGGDNMATAGVEIDFPTNHLGTVGVSEAVRTLPSLFRAFSQIRQRVRRDPPNVAVLIGNDVFSVLLGRWLQRRGVPTISFFPPQVWIWGALAPLINRSFSQVLTCFPQEMEVYGSAAAGTDCKVTFVGHYLAESLTPRSPHEQSEARRELCREAGPLIALLPGSRKHEIGRLLPVLLDAAGGLIRRNPNIRFVLPLAEEQYRREVESAIERRSLSPFVILNHDSHKAMQASDLALIVSGTASLEAALLGVPMVIVYRVSGLTHFVVKSAITVGLMNDSIVGLPNLILQRPVVPEIKQRHANARELERQAWALLTSPGERDRMAAELLGVAARIGTGNCMARAAKAVVELARSASSTAGHETPSLTVEAPSP